MPNHGMHVLGMHGHALLALLTHEQLSGLTIELLMLCQGIALLIEQGICRCKAVGHGGERILQGAHINTGC